MNFIIDLYRQIEKLVYYSFIRILRLNRLAGEYISLDILYIKCAFLYTFNTFKIE